jgi:hypothetical protein
MPRPWPRVEARSVQQLRGVGDQETPCQHTDGDLPCFDCLVGGSA